jgi:hypothetical protein
MDSTTWALLPYFMLLSYYRIRITNQDQIPYLIASVVTENATFMMKMFLSLLKLGITHYQHIATAQRSANYFITYVRTGHSSGG